MDTEMIGRTNTVRAAVLRMIALATIAASTIASRPSATFTNAARCTLVPGTTLALIRVEKDTTLSFAPANVELMSGSGVRPGPMDSLLATASTPMPGARVSLLQMDSSTRAILNSQGVSEAQPVAFIRAAPFRADCRTVRWMDTAQFAVAGETGYVRATLSSRENWINGTPVFVIPETFYYPYPRRRGLAFGVAPTAPLASPDAMFSLNTLLDIKRGSVPFEVADSIRRTRAMAWAAANRDAAELEPARMTLRRAILDPDWRIVEKIPCRLRGTYRVDMQSGGNRSTWYFRTHDRPGYPWNAGDSLQKTSRLLASPHILGYRLVGYASETLDSIPATNLGLSRIPLVWLTMDDRPTVPGNEKRSSLTGILEFNLGAASETVWNDLETFIPRMSAMDSTFIARLNRPIPLSQRQPRIPVTLRLDNRGGIRGDTALLVGGHKLRVVVERLDTLSTRRPF